MNHLIPENFVNADKDDYAPALIEYFEICVRSVWKQSRGRARHILLLALSDVFGGFLHVYALPCTKRQYYAGLVRYRHVQDLYNLYQDLVTFLMTNGGNWRKPKEDFDNRMSLKPLVVSPTSTQTENMCKKLITFNKNYGKACEDKENTLSVPLPVMDNAQKPCAIVLPLRDPNFNLLSLYSPKSPNVLQLYYVTSVNCLNNSADSAMIFKLQFYRWLKSRVLPRLQDDRWYPAFGGVLPILAALEREGVARNDYVMSTFYSSGVDETKTSAKLGVPLALKIENSTSTEKNSVDEYFEAHMFAVIGCVVFAVLLVCLFIIFCYAKLRRRKTPGDVTVGGKVEDDNKLFANKLQVLFNVKHHKDKDTQVGRRGSSVANLAPGSKRSRSSVGKPPRNPPSTSREALSNGKASLRENLSSSSSSESIAEDAGNE